MVTSSRLINVSTALIQGLDVLDSILLPLPTFDVDCRPDRKHKEIGVVPARVKDREVLREEVRALILTRLVIPSQGQVVDPQDESEEGWDDKHGDVMDQECEVQGIFLAIVARNEHDWLNVLHELSHAEHATDQRISVLVPTLHDGFFLMRVQHEMRADYLSLYKRVDIELFFEDFLVQTYALGCIESLKVVLSLSHKWKRLELVLKHDAHADLFCLLVEDTITEVDKN